DGFDRTSPVTAFPPNGFGLHDMIGNVWEWTTDWFSPKHQADAPKTCCIPENPRGGRAEDSYDPRQPGAKIPRKVIKGVSHLGRPDLLPPLSPSGAPCGGCGHVNKPSGISLHHSTGVPPRLTTLTIKGGTHESETKVLAQCLQEPPQWSRQVRSPPRNSLQSPISSSSWATTSAGCSQASIIVA